MSLAIIIYKTQHHLAKINMFQKLQMQKVNNEMSMVQIIMVLDTAFLSSLLFTKKS